VPLLQPDAIKKREWVKKKTRGKANARGLACAEIAGEEERRAAKGVNNIPLCSRPFPFGQPPGGPFGKPYLITQCTEFTSIYGTRTAIGGGSSEQA
jgi:hypothetical protein